MYTFGYGIKFNCIQFQMYQNRCSSSYNEGFLFNNNGRNGLTIDRIEIAKG